MKVTYEFEAGDRVYLAGMEFVVEVTEAGYLNVGGVPLFKNGKYDHEHENPLITYIPELTLEPGNITIKSKGVDYGC